MNTKPLVSRVPLLSALTVSALLLSACVVDPGPRPGVDYGYVAGGFGTPAPVYTPAPAPVYTPAPPATVYYEDSYYNQPGYAYGPSYYGPGYYGPNYGVSGTIIYSEHDHYSPGYRNPPPRADYYDRDRGGRGYGGYRGNGPGPRDGHGGGGWQGNPNPPQGGQAGPRPGGDHGNRGNSPLSPALRGVLGKDRDDHR